MYWSLTNETEILLYSVFSNFTHQLWVLSEVFIFTMHKVSSSYNVNSLFYKSLIEKFFHTVCIPLFNAEN